MNDLASVEVSGTNPILVGGLDAADDFASFEPGLDGERVDDRRLSGLEEA